MAKSKSLPMERIEPLIHVIRGHRVILDRDLATIYGVQTKVLNQAVKRNREKFPEDFMFQLDREEAEERGRLRSQIVTLKRGEHRKYLPYAFTEHGAIMAATVLNSAKAVEMSVFVVRVFVRMRDELASRRDTEMRLAQIENILFVHDDKLRELFDKIRPLLLPPPERPKKRIGFGIRERRARYGTPRRKRKTNT